MYVWVFVCLCVYVSMDVCFSINGWMYVCVYQCVSVGVWMKGICMCVGYVRNIPSLVRTYVPRYIFGERESESVFCTHG